MLGAALSLLGVVAFFFWAVLGHSTPAEQQAVVDASCPAQTKVIRYPEHLGGPHQAVCNPTFTAWRN
jgi:hypothetical protein